ncbi:MAG TPA: hypothetical protein VME47_03850, partial [Acetobacteraceae bacterium]|nr:hypothetical protein [Acetobacteraceae bacterium]
MRDTPEDVLRAIRETEVRAKRAPFIPETNAPPTPDSSDTAIMHVGRLPKPRSLVPPERPAASPPNEALPPMVVAEVIDPRMDSETPNDAPPVSGDPTHRGIPWSRTALAATVAAAVLLIGDPLHRHEAPPVEKASPVSFAQQHALVHPRSQPAPAIVAAERTHSSKVRALVTEPNTPTAAVIANKIHPSRPGATRTLSNNRSDHAAKAAPDHQRQIAESSTAMTTRPRALTHSNTTQAPSVAGSAAPANRPHLVPAHAAPVLIEKAQAAPPSVPPSPTPRLVPVLATATLPQIAEPSEPADQAPRHNPIAHTPDHASAPPHLQHKQAVADAAKAAPDQRRQTAESSTATTSGPGALTRSSNTQAPSVEASAAPAARPHLVPVQSAPILIAKAEASVPPSPPPRLVPVVATATLPQIAEHPEQSEPADQAPRDNAMAHRPDHASAPPHLPHKQAAADPNLAAHSFAQPETHPNTHPVPHHDALTRVMARLRAG